MMITDFSKLVNLLWRECIANLNQTLSESETAHFSNNDYYYMLVIQSLKTPKLSELAETLGVTKPAVTAIVRKLSNMQLIEKVQSDEDRRIFFIQLTNKGETLLSGDQKVYDWVAACIQNMLTDSKELELVDKVISNLVKQLEEREL